MPQERGPWVRGFSVEPDRALGEITQDWGISRRATSSIAVDAAIC